ncbi:MAG: hypothetical protein PX481_17300 [Microcystis sp. M53603_WE2]|jgi:tRNA A37 N6-isopentenylltransferase MiaA|uniref:hypothetical protein n=1 Tax=unclassified Microcystis TaxID=2643300 RepID=UPI0022C14061|nr:MULTISPECIES: hypothetical protein [unclassified Microcystis]MCE2663441.1 hypothetical protein [Microcystis sp. 53602_E8]MCZ8363366.1 hypothetical protein [Microcystis sp. LE19-251.1A]MDJ0528039.1 hypothetical protein [Microcystis sp. M53600_WE12]MDJ0544718.1 hypothetical protein [Microcystis sp. M53601_WE4]MCZ8027141.1 hypothetical protein [Microcystis sp. LE19-10.1B]
MNHLRILENVLKEASRSFGTLELIALTATHISEYCQNRQEKREAYRIAAKIIKCDAKQLKAICEKLDQLQSQINFDFDFFGGVGHE